MRARIRLSDGRQIHISVAEVVVTDDFGQPLALSYEENGLVAHTDATKSDFSSTVRKLGMTPTPIEVIRSGGR